MAEDNLIPNVPARTGAEETILDGGGQWDDAHAALYVLARHDENGVLQEEGIPTALLRYAPTVAQRAAIALGEDLYVAMALPNGRSPLPLQVQVGPGSFTVEGKILDSQGRARAGAASAAPAASGLILPEQYRK